MKKLLNLIILLVLSANSVSAQNGVYLSIQDMQGDGLYYESGYVQGMLFKACSHMVSGDYDSAYDIYTKIIDDYNYLPVLSNLGIIYELGLIDETGELKRKLQEFAYENYCLGAKFGEKTCIFHKKRVETEGFYPDAYKETYLRNLKTGFEALYGPTNNPIPNGIIPGGMNAGGNISSGSSSSLYSKCTVCGGSGTCKSCGGSGGYWSEVGGYVGKDIKKRNDCPSCHGSKKCYMCHGSGRI